MALIFQNPNIFIYNKSRLISIDNRLFKIIFDYSLDFMNHQLSHVYFRKLFPIARVDFFALSFRVHFTKGNNSGNVVRYTLFLVSWVDKYQTCTIGLRRIQKFLKKLILKKNMRLAFAMVLHPRLGRNSTLSMLYSDLIQYIMFIE